MKSALTLCFASLVVISFVASGPATAQDQPSAPDMAKMMEQWTKAATPGEHHKHLDGFVGTWNTTTRMWMEGPGKPPAETPGKSETKWVLDGRFIMEEHAGQMMGKPYSGIGLTGYDNYQNMYISIWACNQATSLLSMKGTRDPSGKRWTFYGEMDEPMLDVRGREVKYVTEVQDADHYVFAVYDLAAGDDYKVVEIAYSRAK